MAFLRRARGVLLYVDYAAAAVWGLYPLALFDIRDIPCECVALEVGIFALNIIVSSRCGPETYDIAHSIWHVASAAKCIWVARRLRQKKVLKACETFRTKC